MSATIANTDPSVAQSLVEPTKSDAVGKPVSPKKKTALVKSAAPKKVSLTAATAAVEPKTTKKTIPIKKTMFISPTSEKAVKPAKIVKVKNHLPPLANLPTVEKEKLKKIRLIRDSFSMPEVEYAVLGTVKKACLKAGIDVKKSELLRIGVALIQKMDVAALKKVLATLPPLKAGRPKQEK